MRLLTRITAFLIPLLLVPTVTLAGSCGSGGGLVNPINTCDLATFLARLLQLVARIAFPIIVLFIVYIGFLFVSSQGNPEKLKEARGYFVWAVVGALLILGAEALSYAIRETVRQL